MPLVTGDICSTCLQLYFGPSLNGYCVDSVINITVSTDQSPSLLYDVTLMVNDRACNDSGDEIVECDDVNIDFIHSFILTAINTGTITIKAHMNYYGADWYSDTQNMTIVEECTVST